MKKNIKILVICFLMSFSFFIGPRVAGYTSQQCVIMGSCTSSSDTSNSCYACLLNDAPPATPATDPAPASPTAAPANTQSAAAQVKLEDPLGLTTDQQKNPIPYLANRLIQTALGFSGVLALLAFIYGGLLYLMAGLDANNVKKAKEVMKYAVIGLLIIFLSSPIVLFILKTVLQVK